MRFARLTTVVLAVDFAIGFLLGWCESLHWSRQQ